MKALPPYPPNKEDNYYARPEGVALGEIGIVVLFIIVIAIAFACSGCTATHIKTPTWKLSRISIGQAMEIPSISVSADGAVTVAGYKSDGGAKALSDAVSAAIKGLKL